MKLLFFKSENALFYEVSAYHFFSGMGLGTVLTLQGTLGCPPRFRPSTVPTRVRGRMTNKPIQATAS